MRLFFPFYIRTLYGYTLKPILHLVPVIHFNTNFFFTQIIQFNTVARTVTSFRKSLNRIDILYFYARSFFTLIPLYVSYYTRHVYIHVKRGLGVCIKLLKRQRWYFYFYIIQKRIFFLDDLAKVIYNFFSF